MRHTVLAIALFAAACGKSSSSGGGGGTPIPGTKVVIDLPPGSTISPGNEITLGPSAPPTDTTYRINLMSKPLTKDDEDTMARESQVLNQGGLWDHLPGGVEVFQHGDDDGALVLEAYLDNMACVAVSKSHDMAGLDRCEGIRLAK